MDISKTAWVNARSGIIIEVGAARFLYPSCLNLVAYLHVKDKMEDAKNLKGYIFLQYTDFLISLPMISS